MNRWCWWIAIVVFPSRVPFNLSCMLALGSDRHSMCVCVCGRGAPSSLLRSINYARASDCLQTKTLNLIEFKHLVDSMHSSRCKRGVCLSQCAWVTYRSVDSRWHSSRTAFHGIFGDKLRGKHVHFECDAPTYARARLGASECISI